MTTFSQSLKLELIGDGQQSGTWGQTTNKNLGTLLEQAITGVISITMTDTNYTLTSFNGVSDEARNAVIVAVGTNSAQRDIIAPLVNKIYTISNNTVGGYAIRIRASVGDAVTIPNGVTTSVYCDGSDFYNMQVGTTGNETINGNLTVTGTANIAGATTVGGNLSGTTATFSGAISSVSPAFTGVPTAPTAPNGTNTTQIATTAFVQALQSNVNITGGSISGVAISNSTLASNVSWGAMPAGTKVLFAQAAAPTGWTQVTTDTATNRMLRVVNTAGGGVGGSNDPTLMNVVPSHTHTFTSGTESASHTHAGTTGNQSADHTHTYSSTTTAGQGGHVHYFPELIFGVTGGTTGVTSSRTSSVYYAGFHEMPDDGTHTGQHQHTVSGTTAGVSANHTHNFTSGTESTTHTHSGTTAANGSASNWTPRYLDLILCTKN